jgi:hypothetical protein
LSEEKSAIALHQLVFEASIAESSYFRIRGQNEAAGAVIAAAAAFEEFGGPDTLSHRR